MCGDADNPVIEDQATPITIKHLFTHTAGAIFCIKNDEFCIKNEEFGIENDAFCM